MSKSKTTSKKTTTKKATPANNLNEGRNCNKKLWIICAIISIIVIFAIVKISNNSVIFDNNDDNKAKIDRSASVETAGDVEKVVEAWIANNPEKILESVINMQKKQAQQQVEEAGANISKNLDKLYENKNDPNHSPKGYDVAIVEFFDYNCGYCKRAVKTIEEVVAKDKKVKVVFKELPILGKSSEDLSKVSLAFNIANSARYLDFHTALMKSSARSTAEAIKIAGKHGVSPQKINAVLTKYKDKIQKEIDDNRELAASIGVNGTPAFLVGEQLFPGAVGFDTIKQAVQNARDN